uniref:Ion transport domain-containing protein n=1 Tax=Chromera velia CCMP2878 TaxID=1169474 RepID=A0A0G4G3R7_9ALVE|eukprot:Cvel_20054.t1-p1 / transcript=Cvel_20054.t1 / gene=Cvel_20054 / organism=Chromera_velia_CCMP2878 / gene_product=hypothetical protein / transcript_product=hypothetical protein / location=Cvel_scaffold1773:4482-11695(-) / protein_length=1104 / sequence_SO=supercontig / SO=protein_coding / is_pseudo=false
MFDLSPILRLLFLYLVGAVQGEGGLGESVQSDGTEGMSEVGFLSPRHLQGEGGVGDGKLGGVEGVSKLCLAARHSSAFVLEGEQGEQWMWTHEDSVHRLFDAVLDFIIFLTYISIPLQIFIFTLFWRLSVDQFPLSRILRSTEIGIWHFREACTAVTLFILFIFMCGLTHGVNAIQQVASTARLQTALTVAKFATTAVSAAAAGAMMSAVPSLITWLDSVEVTRKGVARELAEQQLKREKTREKERGKEKDEEERERLLRNETEEGEDGKKLGGTGEKDKRRRRRVSSTSVLSGGDGGVERQDRDSFVSSASVPRRASSSAVSYSDPHSHSNHSPGSLPGGKTSSTPLSPSLILEDVPEETVEQLRVEEAEGEEPGDEPKGGVRIPPMMPPHHTAADAFEEETPSRASSVPAPMYLLPPIDEQEDSSSSSRNLKEPNSTPMRQWPRSSTIATGPATTSNLQMAGLSAVWKRQAAQEEKKKIEMEATLKRAQATFKRLGTLLLDAARYRPELESESDGRDGRGRADSEDITCVEGRAAGIAANISQREGGEEREVTAPPQGGRVWGGADEGHGGLEWEGESSARQLDGVRRRFSSAHAWTSSFSRPSLPLPEKVDWGAYVKRNRGEFSSASARTLWRVCKQKVRIQLGKRTERKQGGGEKESESPVSSPGLAAGLQRGLVEEDEAEEFSGWRFLEAVCDEGRCSPEELMKLFCIDPSRLPRSSRWRRLGSGVRGGNLGLAASASSSAATEEGGERDNQQKEKEGADRKRETDSVSLFVLTSSGVFSGPSGTKKKENEGDPAEGKESLQEAPQAAPFDPLPLSLVKACLLCVTPISEDAVRVATLLSGPRLRICLREVAALLHDVPIHPERVSEFSSIVAKLLRPRRPRPGVNRDRDAGSVSSSSERSGLQSSSGDGTGGGVSGRNPRGGSPLVSGGTVTPNLSGAGTSVSPMTTSDRHVKVYASSGTAKTGGGAGSALFPSETVATVSARHILQLLIPPKLKVAGLDRFRAEVSVDNGVITGPGKMDKSAFYWDRRGKMASERFIGANRGGGATVPKPGWFLFGLATTEGVAASMVCCLALNALGRNAARKNLFFLFAAEAQVGM